MTFKEQLAFVRKRLACNHNVIFIIIFSLLVLVIYGSVIGMNFTIDSQKSFLEKDLGHRTIFTGMPVEDIQKLEHIEYYASSKYENILWSEDDAFDTVLVPGELSVKALFPNMDLEIVKGRNILNSGEAICPEKFYPHSLYVGPKMEIKIYNSLYLRGKKVLGKSFKVKSQNEENLGQITNFVIVGTYKNKKFVEANTCYVSMSDYDKNYRNDNVKTNLIFVNDQKNVRGVLDQIEKMGYLGLISDLDAQMLNYLFFIPAVICIVVFIMSINIIFSFVVKKSIYRSRDMGMLKAIGYQNGEILKLEILENVLVTLISFGVATVLLGVCYQIVTQKFMLEFIYNNYYLPVPIVYLILISFLIVVVVMNMTKKGVKKYLNKNTITLLKNEGKK